MKESKEGKTVRQNGAYTPTRKHEANLRRNPTLHFQIGLILALIASIFFMEMRMPVKALAVPKDVVEDEIFVWNEQFQVEEIKVDLPRVVVQPKEPEPLTPEAFTEVPDDTALFEPKVGTTETSTEKPIDPNKVTYVDKEEPIADVPFALIENVPLFPGCEGLSTNDERRDCMSTNISKFVNKKFRTDVADGLGLKTGRNQIYVVFKIDSDGKVTDITARAPHQDLEKEARRVTKLLPDMIPGNQGGKNVGVTFALPITFILQN